MLSWNPQATECHFTKDIVFPFPAVRLTSFRTKLSTCITSFFVLNMGSLNQIIVLKETGVISCIAYN